MQLKFGSLKTMIGNQTALKWANISTGSGMWLGVKASATAT